MWLTGLKAPTNLVVVVVVAVVVVVVVLSQLKPDSGDNSMVRTSDS